MTEDTKSVQLPAEINSARLGPDGLPLDTSRPLAPEMPNDEMRSRFPATGGALAAEIRRAAEDDGTATATAAQAVPGMPSVAGIVDGGVGAKTDRRPKVRFLNEAKAGRDYTLLDPLEVDEVEYLETKISSPTGGRYGLFQQISSDAGSDQTKIQSAIIWLVTNLPLVVVENLSIDDRNEILKVGYPFLPRLIQKFLAPMMRAFEDADEAAATAAAGSSNTPASAG